VSPNGKSVSSKAKTLDSSLPHNRRRVAIEKGEQIGMMKWRALGSMSFNHPLLLAVTQLRVPYERREALVSDDAVLDGGTDPCIDNTRPMTDRPEGHGRPHRGSWGKVLLGSSLHKSTLGREVHRPGARTRPRRPVLRRGMTPGVPDGTRRSGLVKVTRDSVER
jgi:hypothetical protein